MTTFEKRREMFFCGKDCHLTFFEKKVAEQMFGTGQCPNPFFDPTEGRLRDIADAMYQEYRGSRVASANAMLVAVKGAIIRVNNKLDQHIANQPRLEIPELARTISPPNLPGMNLFQV